MESPNTVYAISMNWFRQWQNFIRTKCDPPGPIDNSNIVNQSQPETVKQGSDYAQISEELWLFFHRIYSGGPEIKLRTSKVASMPPTRSQSVTAITSTHFENLSITGAESVPEFFIPPLKPKKQTQTFDSSIIIESEKNIAPVHEPQNFFNDKEVTADLTNDSVTVEINNSTSDVVDNDIPESIKSENHDQSADEISSVNENVQTEHRQVKRNKRRFKPRKVKNKFLEVDKLEKTGNGDK